MFYFIFSGLSLLTLVIVCVAEPNVEEAITRDRGAREPGRVSLESTESREGASLETTETREGKSKFWELKSMYYISVFFITIKIFQYNFCRKNQTILVWFDLQENKKCLANDLFIFWTKNQIVFNSIKWLRNYSMVLISINFGWLN